MSAVRLCRLWKVHPNGVVAVRDLDADIADGEFFVIVGPSGCGKTTVLRMIAGLEEPSSGDIVIDGVRVNELTPQQRDIAMAFQDYALYPHMSVAKNLGFALWADGVHSDQIAARVHDVATQLDIADVLDRRPRELSGGQRQRVALGRSIIRNPRVFLMDEPMSHLDSKLRIEARAQVLNIQRRLGTTTVFVTHDQVEAMALADRVAVMRDGRIVQEGSPSEIYEQPRDLFVAQFMGSPPMSIVLARIDGTDSGIALELAGRSIAFDRAALARRPWLRELTGRQIAVGIRPEMLRSDSGGPLTASVSSTETHGSEQLVHATIGAQRVSERDGVVVVDPDRHAPIAVRVGAHDDIDLWRPLVLAVDLDRVQLFDLATGLTIHAPCR